MKKFILFLCLISFTQIAKAQIDPVLADQLQSVLDNRVSISGNHGVSVHLIMPDGQTWDGTAGLGKQDIPITDTTLFHGASTTKMNIAILMLLLAEDNLIDLDLSWNNYVTLNNEGIDTLITVRQLLNHTSGIADYLETSGSGDYVTSDFNHFYTPQYILDSIVSGVPDFPAGTDFQYSNSNYVLAALIADSVTVNPLESELRTRIWNPLGMNHTYFGAYETYTEPTAGVWWNFGNGTMNYSDSSTTSMLSFGYAAGNIVSCPTDLALLLRGLLSGQLLNTQSLNEMLTFVPESYSSWTAGYGLGIHHQFGQTEDTVLGHDGYYTNLTDMFHSMNCGFTLVTMTNTQTEWFGIYNPMHDILVNYITSTDVIEFENNIDLTVYPNPAKEELTINASFKNKTSGTLALFDNIGRALYRYEFDENMLDHEIDLSSFSPGTYLLEIKTDRESYVEKVMILE